MLPLDSPNTQHQRRFQRGYQGKSIYLSIYHCYTPTLKPRQSTNYSAAPERWRPNRTTTPWEKWGVKQYGLCPRPNRATVLNNYATTIRTRIGKATVPNHTWSIYNFIRKPPWLGCGFIWILNWTKVTHLKKYPFGLGLHFMIWKKCMWWNWQNQQIGSRYPLVNFLTMKQVCYERISSKSVFF